MAKGFGVATVVVVFAVIAGFGWLMLSLLSDATDVTDGKAEPVEVAVGATARVESFEATVRSVDCDKRSFTRRPDDPATSYDDSDVLAAKGKFCVVSFSVKNVGAKTDSYPTYSLEATNATERVLEKSYAAQHHLNKGANLLGEPIDPGKVVEEFLVYDVPTDTTLAYLTLAPSYSDSPVKVKIG